jgi:hypothetical protein
MYLDQCLVDLYRQAPLCFSLHPSISEDKLEQQHAVFTQYKDPCRLGPGEDKPWALGEWIEVWAGTGGSGCAHVRELGFASLEKA